MIGVPKTAKTFPLNPSALPSAPQWVVIMSGKSFHIMIPNKAGSKIIIDDIITLILFFLSIIIIPFQICNPKQGFLQNRGVDFIENELSFSCVSN